jgi:hypothetical protein
MQHDEKLGTGLIHHVVPQGRLAMQHDEKLGTMKLIMFSSEGGYHGTTILILILMQRTNIVSCKGATLHLKIQVQLVYKETAQIHIVILQIVTKPQIYKMLHVEQFLKSIKWQIITFERNSCNINRRHGP